ncbi:MAG TPA: hypothetical protein VF734_10080 [Pseudonocardiaceae bacterium]
MLSSSGRVECIVAFPVVLGWGERTGCAALIDAMELGIVKPAGAGDQQTEDDRPGGTGE